MDPNTFRLFASSRSPASFTLGEATGGGYFAGYISHSANGIATHALIIAPAETGASGSGYTLTTAYSNSSNGNSQPTITSVYDGRLNTDRMIEIGISTFLAAQFCIGLSIGGFTDWYLPSLSELGIAYRNLKPTTQTNSTFYGVNQYSVPLSNSNYSSGTPSQTALTLFQSGNAQAFMANGHWTSTYDSLFNNTHRLSFSNGESPAVSPSGNTGSVRAFRRIAL
jgi:hypothetical protein